MYNFRTDLADERRDLFRQANNLENEIPRNRSGRDTKKQVYKYE